MVKALIIIPTRMSSSRFPGKPLINIEGKTMLERVWCLAKKAKIGDVYVACCDKKIKDLLIEKNIPYIFTRKNLKSGTDRVYNAFQKIKDRASYNLVINLQGDIPFFNPNYLIRLYNLFKLDNYKMATLASPIKEKGKINDPNIVKIAMARYKNNAFKALYFSRLPIPHGSKNYYEHVGIYAYNPKTLKDYVSMRTSKLENSERLEQLRALENNIQIDISLAKSSPIGVDTKEDFEKVRNLLEIKK